MLELRRGDAAMNRISARTALLMSLPPLLWAGNAVVGRLVVGSVSPMTLNFLRWTIAALLLLPLGWHALREPREVLSRWRYLLLIGTLAMGMYNALQYLALVTTTPLNVTLIAASLPVAMMIVGSAFYGVHPTRRQLVGAALSIAGVLLVISRGDPRTLARVQFVAGDLYIVVAVIAWALYSWLLVRPPASMRDDARPAWNWAAFLLVQILFGLVGAGAAAAGEVALGLGTIAWSGWTVAALLFVAIGPGIVAYRCWGLGVAQGGPALAAFFANLTPLFAALMSAAVLRETPRWFHALAFALIVAGILVSTKVGTGDHKETPGRSKVP
jgi:drug/metabolite transporter (DMT)-like permease